MLIKNNSIALDIWVISRQYLIFLNSTDLEWIICPLKLKKILKGKKENKIAFIIQN